MSDKTNVPGMETPYQNYNFGYDNPATNTGSPFPSQPMNAGMFGGQSDSPGTVVGGFSTPIQMPGVPTSGMASAPQQAENGFKPSTNSGKPIYGFLFSVSRTPFGEFWPLYQGNNIIGRDPSCDICLPESTVSRQHMSLVIRKNRNPEKVVAAVRDMGSTEGTMLNGQSLDFDVVECRSGDIITVGQCYELLFIMVDATALGLKPAENFSLASMPLPQHNVFPSTQPTFQQAQHAFPQQDISGFEYQMPPSFRPESAPMNPSSNTPRYIPNDGTVGLDGLGGIGRGGTVS